VFPFSFASADCSSSGFTGAGGNPPFGCGSAKKALTHLLTREITHANMFMKALDDMGKLSDPMFGNVPPVTQ
jgi:hypothetical protein